MKLILLSFSIKLRAEQYCRCPYISIFQYHAMLTLVLGTCRLKGKSILVFLKDVLNTPDEIIHVITKSLLDSS